MSCPYEISMKRKGGVDALGHMQDWCAAMHKSNSQMGREWDNGYNMALKGFHAKLQAMIDELEGVN